MEGGSNTKKYPCNFCDRVFITAQALGGHRNSHRRERDFVKLSRVEDQDQLIQMTPTLLPFSYSTIQTNNPKIREVLMPYENNCRYPRQIFVHNRMISKELYYHPYAHQRNAHQNDLVPWKKLYSGSRYPPNSNGNFRSMSRYPFVSSQGESSQGHQNLKHQPQNYGLLLQNNGGVIKNGYHINLGASNSIAGEK